MEHQIVDKPAFKVIGKALRVTTKDGENFRRIPQFWQECVSDGTVGRLVEVASTSDALPNVTLGICADFADDMSEFTYVIAAAGAPTPHPDDWIEKAIPAATWAVFEATGAMPDSIQAVWIGIWSEFFTSSSYRHGDGPDVEIYPPGDPMAPDYRSEVWVPVVHK
jgi:AraC family transcriptional regulator